MGKKTNKAKLEIFKFLRKSSKAIAYEKIGGNYAFWYFCMQNSYLRWKNSNSYYFHEKCKIEQEYFGCYLWDFHRNSWAEYQKKMETCFLDGNSNFWENQFYRKVIAFDKIGGNYALKFYKNMLIKVFLHAEFISAMKTEKWKRQNNRKMNNFGNFC